MPVAAPISRPQTIKQAKAAYKARGQPSLTEQQKRQLDRAIELDRRAWRTREADKKKAEAAKKRLEKERKQKEEAERIQLGTQRRCDRFGYKSSQMHLGAFLNRKCDIHADSKENVLALAEESEADSFDDDDLDDETLLDALATTSSAEGQDAGVQPSHVTATGFRNAHSTTAMTQKHLSTSTEAMNDLDSFWDDLDTSTQIARDLASDDIQKAKQKPSSKASSFSSGDFDLTIEDMELLDPQKHEQDRKLMPPPPLPPKHVQPMDEFTMSQLEQFVDEDLQLTQPD